MKHLISASAGALALALAGPAGAAIVFGTGAGVIQPEENVLYTNSPPDGLLVTGVTNQSHTLVAVQGGETLHAHGGQAKVQAVDGAVSSVFSFHGLLGQQLGVDLVDPTLAFGKAEFKLKVQHDSATEATLTFFDTAGMQYQDTFAIPSNGFFYAYVTGNTRIDRFSIATNGTFEDMRQLRLGVIGPLPPDVVVNPGGVPEPATWALMILGVGAAGSMLRSSRRSAPPIGA